MAAKEASTALSAIAGTTLESVTFVMDYVQFQFGPARLTAYTFPQVGLSARCWTAKDEGWRDSLCARIGVRVRGASCSGKGLEFDFEDGATITISLRDEDYRGPEAFMLSVPHHPIIVS